MCPWEKLRVNYQVHVELIDVIGGLKSYIAAY